MIIYAYSLILAIIILTPLGFKWQIKNKIVIIGTLTIGLITGILTNAILGITKNIGFLHLILIEVFIILLLAGVSILLTFYRDPERNSPKEKGIILSPADGKVIYIKKLEAGKVPYSKKKGKKFELSDLTKSEFFRDEGYLIGISMNFLNVHVNRAPIGGKITSLKHIKGKFFSLRKEESIIENERVLMVIKNDEFEVGIIQIASRLVRRIVTFLKEGESVEIGQRVGMIKFGSQVDIILPNHNNLEIQVKKGIEIKAGISIIAKYKDKKGV